MCMRMCAAQSPPHDQVQPSCESSGVTMGRGSHCYVRRECTSQHADSPARCNPDAKAGYPGLRQATSLQQQVGAHRHFNPKAGPAMRTHKGRALPRGGWQQWAADMRRDRSPAAGILRSLSGQQSGRQRCSNKAWFARGKGGRCCVRGRGDGARGQNRWVCDSDEDMCIRGEARPE